MAEVWKSKESQIISKYAEKLEPVEDEEQEGKPANPADRTRAQPLSRTYDEGIDFRYMNAPPPKDLLNYKNMDLEMSLWAKTQAGWLSVIVLLVMAGICFIMTWILWGMHGY